MTNTTETVSKETARSLAVAYQAFAEYHAKGEHDSVAFWGARLQDLQEKTDIVFYPTAWLDHVIESAEYRAQRQAA